MRRRARACVAGMGRERVSPLPSMGNEGRGGTRAAARACVWPCSARARGGAKPPLPSPSFTLHHRESYYNVACPPSPSSMLKQAAPEK